MASKQETDKSEKKDGEDLTTILDKSQRADLTLLIAHITESMRNLIVQNFDATAGLDAKFLPKEGMTEDEKMMAADPNADLSKYEQQKKLREENKKDLATLKMKNLKKNTLKAYDDWRLQVVQRVGKVLNSDIMSKDQAQESSSTETRPTAPETIGKIVETPKRSSNLKFKDLFPPTKTRLTKLPMDRRTLILHSILLLLLSLEHYNAASRILLLNITSSLKLPLRTFEQDEYVTAKGLLENAKELTATEETRKKAEENQDLRKQKVRYAAIAGAAIIGVAGGFAAPLLAAGIGSVASGLGLGTTAAAGYLGSVASSSLLVGSLFGAYGGRMTGQMMDKYAREVEDFEFLPVHSNERTSEDPKHGAQQASEHDHKLRVTICLSGWLTEKEEVIKPWRVLGSGAEVFALKYELEALLNLGNAMEGMVQSAAWGYAQKELIQQTIFADLMAAMWPLGLLKVARVIDNPFSVAKARAEKVGEVLADALVNRAQGERPVTLIGYSLGARAIYVCLQSLAKRRAFNLVENAVLIGAPTPSDTSDWRVLRSVVSGRLVNVFSKNDYILGFMYRTSAIQYGVAGLQPVEGLAGVENVDASEDVDGHLRYRFLVGAILKKIGFEDVDMQAVEEEQEAMKKMIEEEKRNSLQAQRNRLIRRESHQGGKVDEDAEAEAEASDIEEQVKEKTKKSLVTRVIEWWYTPRAPNTKDAEKVAGNLSRAAQDPSQVGAAAKDTVQDVRDSSASIAQRVYQALPNIPYMSSSGATGGVAKAGDGKIAGDVAQQSQSYTSKAAGYLPKSMPSMPSMPAMPSIPGYSKPKDTSSRPAKKTKEAGETAKKGTTAVTDTVGTTVKNTANIQDNPATKQVKEVPGIKQAVVNDPGVTQGLGKVTGIVGTTVSNTTDMATGTTDNVVDKAGQGGSKAVETVDSGVQNVGSKIGIGDKDTTSNKDSNKKKSSKSKSKSKSESTDEPKQQSYTSYAASYLPSMPTWRSSTSKDDPKSAPKDSGKQSAPKADQKKPSESQTSTKKRDTPPPKLERTRSSQVQSEQVKDQDIESRQKSSSRPPPPKLGRNRSSNTNTNTKQSQQNVKSPSPKLGPRKVSQRDNSGGASASQIPGADTAQKATSTVTEGSSQVAQKASNTVTEGSSQVAQKGTETAGQLGQMGSQGGQAVGSGAKKAGGALGGALGGARKMVGFGGR